MNTMLKAGLAAVAMILGQQALADDAAAPAAAATEAPAAGAAVVQVTPTGEQVVTVNTGNQVVDAAANMAVKCGEKAAAMKTCDSMGSFKAMACRKLAEMRYKGVECPLQ